MVQQFLTSFRKWCVALFLEPRFGAPKVKKRQLWLLLAIAAAAATTATSTCSTRTNPKSNLKLFILRLNFRPLSCKAQDHHQRSSPLHFHSFFPCSNRDHRITGSKNANTMVIEMMSPSKLPCLVQNCLVWVGVI